MGLLNPGGPIAQFKRNRCSISPVEVILLSGVRKKRRKIQIGDIIEFSNTETGEKIGAKVSAQYVFDSFESLYKELSLLECGYTEADIETASPDDMNVYYSKDNQQKYGVVGIRIALL